jgi:hypothetical protein
MKPSSHASRVFARALEKADVRGRVELANRAGNANRDVRAAATPNRKPRRPQQH